jgi:hypothetical protein
VKSSIKSGGDVTDESARPFEFMPELTTEHFVLQPDASSAISEAAARVFGGLLKGEPEEQNPK